MGAGLNGSILKDFFYILEEIAIGAGNQWAGNEWLDARLPY